MIIHDIVYGIPLGWNRVKTTCGYIGTCWIIFHSWPTASLTPFLTHARQDMPPDSALHMSRRCVEPGAAEWIVG